MKYLRTRVGSDLLGHTLLKMRGGWAIGFSHKGVIDDFHKVSFSEQSVLRE